MRVKIQVEASDGSSVEIFNENIDEAKQLAFLSEVLAALLRFENSTSKLIEEKGRS